MAKLGTAAAISWTSGIGTERVILLDLPLRESRPGFTQSAYTSESLDKTAIYSVTVGSGAHELVGNLKYEDDPQGLLDLIAFGATNGTLTYIPSLTDPDTNYSVKLISPRDVNALTLDLDSQRATFGEMTVEIRFRKTDQTAFNEPYEGTNVLFLYRAGDSLTRATFTRADTANYDTKGYGTVTSAASGAARIHWVDTDNDGIRETPTLLLEPASTNLIVQSSNLSVTWTNAGTTLTSGQTDPAAGTLAYLCGDTSAVAAQSVSITPTFTTDAVSKAFSVFVKQGTATTTVLNLRDVTAGADRLLVSIAWSNGVPTPTASTGTVVGTERHRDGWYRILCQTTAVTVANTNTVFLYPAGTTVANTGDCQFFGVQAENALNPTSYNPTAGGTDARAADTCRFPFTARVQTLSIYLRFIQNGTLPYSSGVSGLLGIGTAATALRYEIRNPTGGVATLTAVVGATSSGSITPGATHGQVVEVLAVFRYTPSTRTATAQIQAAVQGTIGTAGTVSGNAQMSDNFGANLLYLGALSDGTGQAPFPVTHCLVMRGVQDIPTMRRMVGV